MMTTLQEKIVIFVDVLGFSNLTLENSLDIERIVDHEGPLDQIFSGIIIEERKPNKLEEVFSNFHFILQSGFNLAKLNSKFTSITFSDSAYISTKYLNDAVKIVTNLMCGFLRNKVPVRAGIALGSFETLRFKTDIKLDSGEHASHFLGTGVVKAFHTESCGIKGMRVLIHPSIEPLFEELSNTEFIIQNCESHEINNSVGVSKEINYWEYNITDEKEAWRNFQEMWKDSPQKSLIHYEATANSIQKMRIARGYPPIKNLKKVTISRNK